MSNKRKSFLMYLDWGKNIKKMKQEEKGLLMDLMYASYNNETLPEIPEEFLVLDIFWDQVESFIYRNKRDYDKKLDKQSDSPTDKPNTVFRLKADNSSDNTLTKDKDKAKDNIKVKYKGERKEEYEVTEEEYVLTTNEKYLTEEEKQYKAKLLFQ